MQIDITKPVKTAGGLKVINLEYKPRNSAGEWVTYPIKGTIVESEKPLKLTYCIWTVDGRWDAVWGRAPHLNIQNEEA